MVELWKEKEENKKFFLRLFERENKSIFIYLVDEEGKKVDRGAVLFINAKGEMGRCRSMNEDIARRAGIKLDNDGCIALYKEDVITYAN